MNMIEPDFEFLCSLYVFVFRLLVL